MMKIGTFSKKYNISFYTIRFYIKEGLLLPERKNNQYYFDLRCEEDMELILELRECRFSLKEMSKILSIKRLSGFLDEDSVRFVGGMLRQKAKELFEEIEDIELAITRLEKKEEQMDHYHRKKKMDSNGVPIEFLYLLKCPKCGSDFELTDSKLQGTKILEGKLRCQCGYTAKIEEGIVASEQSVTKIQAWPGTSSKIKEYSQEYLNMMFQCYSWMNNQIQTEMDERKVILCNGENGGEFLYQYIQKFGKNNLYIITEVSPKLIQEIRERLGQMMENYSILYISAESDQLPLQKKCVDLVIDDSTSWYDMFDSCDFYLEKVRCFIKEKAQIIGFYPCYSRKSASIKNVKLLYPEANIRCMNWTSMKQSFIQNDMEMLDHKLIGDVNECGKWARYHVVGDPVHMRVFHLEYEGETK